MNAFEVLGIPTDSDQTQVHQAYRTRVKACHPDLFVDREKQQKAQEQLIELNLAYEEALRLSAQKQVGFHAIPAPQAKVFARRLMEQGDYENALLQMGRAAEKDADWYFLQGQILMHLYQYSSAHQAFRAAISLDSENREYRAWALDAALTMKKHQKLPYRVLDWADGIIHPRKQTH